MAMQMFQKNPSGLADRGDKIRGLISLAITITSWSIAYNSFDSQPWLVFWMITGFLNFLVTIGIVFKEV